MISDSLTPRTTILALDLGSTTGWALRAPEGQIAHGFVSFKSQRFEGGGMRYLRFSRWLTDMKATLAAPPRQNSCRPDMILNLGAIRKKDGTVWRSIQEQSGGAVVAAGERQYWRSSL